jgi:predicted PhzF superfamily epimerase YddE/YHI9
MSIPYCVIDVFTAEPFRGNPAAVCWLQSARDAHWMQKAAERAAAPDFERMKSVARDPVCVTARSTIQSFDFVSRFFAPGHGIDEDPVTGAAHCMLGPY